MLCDRACFFSLRHPEFNAGSFFFRDVQNADVDDRDLKDMSVYAIRKSFRKDETIFQQGEPGEFLFIIKTGKVRVINQSMEGREVILAILGQNEIFGEMAMLDGRVRSATVVAHTATEAILIDEMYFRMLITSNPQFFLKILGLFVGRMRNCNQQIELLALRTLKERIASLLYNWAVEENPAGAGSFRLPYTHQEMALMLGTSRECVTRVIKELGEDNLIRAGKSGIEILDLEGLRILGK